jgi:hypothetical protein
MNIICCSGGNDSVALIQWAHENALPAVTVLYNDTGWAAPWWPARIEEIKKDRQRRLEKLKQDVIDTELELEAFTWLVKHDIKIDNCIYYPHKKVFSFGWRDALTDSEKKDIESKIAGFPFNYEFKSA